MRIALRDGRYLLAAMPLRARFRKVAEGRGSRLWQATWEPRGYCVGYGPTPGVARTRLVEDTAARWQSMRTMGGYRELPAFLPSGRSSAALEAVDWLLGAFRAVEEG